MAVADKSDSSATAAAANSQREEGDAVAGSSPLCPKKRTKVPGVRVKGGRIYDSENGKTCHQCRQKTRDFAAFCKMLKNNKLCPLTFCHKCLLNRYGEKADEVGKLDNWLCPKCRGVCNCSFCMKKKGFQPTGILAHTAKATGYNSVHDLLHNKGSEVLTASPQKSPLSNKDSLVSKRNRDKENQCVEQDDVGANEEGLKKERKKGTKRIKRSGGDDNQLLTTVDGDIAEMRLPRLHKLNSNDNNHRHTEANVNLKEVEMGLASASQDFGNDEPSPSENAVAVKKKPLRGQPRKHPHRAHESNSEDIALPVEMPLAEIGGVELPAQDVGAALQFLEFCNAFSKVLDIKNGQPECILRDITKARGKRHRVYSAAINFIIKLLSLLEDDMKKDGDEWLQSLKQCIEESECTLIELPLDFLDMGAIGYDSLESSHKLKILNFLCDEVLVTEELRRHIDEVAAKFDEDRKENKDQVLAVKKKEKLLKQKTKDEMANAILSSKEGTPLSLAEFDDMLSHLRNEADKVHAEVLTSLELVPKKNQRSDAVRTDHVKLGVNRQIFWKLNAYNNRSSMLRQDIGAWNSATLQDSWFIYDEDEEKVVEEYISSLRDSKNERQTSAYIDETTKSDSDSPEPIDCLPQAEKED